MFRVWDFGVLGSGILGIKGLEIDFGSLGIRLAWTLQCSSAFDLCKAFRLAFLFEMSSTGGSTLLVATSGD